jgi:hypothetical protein
MINAPLLQIPIGGMLCSDYFTGSRADNLTKTKLTCYYENPNGGRVVENEPNANEPEKKTTSQKKLDQEWHLINLGCKNWSSAKHLIWTSRES